VTYCRTPLEPAPRGKRRKLDAPTARTSILDDCLAEAEEKAREEKASQENAKQEGSAEDDDKTTKEEAEVKRETSETPAIETITTVASPPKDA